MKHPLTLNDRSEPYDPPPLMLQMRAYAGRIHAPQAALSRHAVIAVIMAVALLAFEVFNFDTTRYALTNLIGDVRFVGIGWATILAIAFCSIDFAGLMRLFTPEQGAEEPREVWYLMGAWLLGATMNAVMTWWAVSLTLLNHNFGNEVLGRETLLRVVPIFVAVLVWVTRILFIGALTVTGEKLLNAQRQQRGARPPAGRVFDDGRRAAVLRERRTDRHPFAPQPAGPTAAAQPVAVEPLLYGDPVEEAERPTLFEAPRGQERAPIEPPRPTPVRPVGNNAPGAAPAGGARQPGGVRRPMPGRNLQAQGRR